MLGEEGLVRSLSCRVITLCHPPSEDSLLLLNSNKDQRYSRRLLHVEPLQSVSSASLLDGFTFASQLS